MKLIPIVLILVGAAMAQTPGTVQASPAIPPAAAKPGVVVFTAAGVVACTINGNAVPATSVTIACVVNGVTIPPYPMPLAANASYTFTHFYKQDGVTVMAQADSAGKVTVSGTANGTSTPTAGVAF